MRNIIGTSYSKRKWDPLYFQNKVTYQRASDITGKSDGDSVISWVDSYGIYSPATNGTGPGVIYRTGVNGINNQPSVEFNGSTSFLSGPQTTTLGDFFSWGVFRAEPSAISQAVIIDRDFSQGFVVVSNSSTNKLVFYVIGTPLSFSITYNRGNNGYYFLERNGSSYFLEVNGLSAVDTITTTSLSNNGITFGCVNPLSPSNQLTGQISEIGLLSSYVSSEEKNLLREYITNKYGIATS